MLWLQRAQPLNCSQTDGEMLFICNTVSAARNAVQHGAGNKHLIVFLSALLALKKSEANLKLFCPYVSSWRDVKPVRTFAMLLNSVVCQVKYSTLRLKFRKKNVSEWWRPKRTRGLSAKVWTAPVISHMGRKMGLENDQKTPVCFKETAHFLNFFCLCADVLDWSRLHRNIIALPQQL